MWVVRVALRRPYSFVVLALLIAIFGVLAALNTPTDIFPSLNIPVVSVGVDRQRSVAESGGTLSGDRLARFTGSLGSAFIPALARGGIQSNEHGVGGAKSGRLVLDPLP
jgi:hypothetical protein